jgi:catechol 2,3-dioxygenase-like lactoylglutathione lyase family enzyme
MKPKISLITLGVADLARARAFYEEGLRFPVEGGGEGVVFFKLAGTWLSLYPREKLAEDACTTPDGSGFRGFTLAHNVSTKEEVAQVLALAERAGGTIVKPAQDVFWGGHSGYFADPDGFLWEVAWNPHMDLT